MNVTADGVPGMPRDIRPLLMGAQLPRIAMTNIDGTVCDFSSLFAGNSVVLVVYRGGW